MEAKDSPKDSKDHLAANVKRRRLALGMTQKELGQKAQIGGASIYQIERASRGAVVGGSLDELARALDCEPWELIQPEHLQPAKTEPDPADVTVTIGSKQFALTRIRKLRS